MSYIDQLQKKTRFLGERLKWSQKAEGESFHLSTVEKRHHRTKFRSNIRRTMEVRGQNQEVPDYENESHESRTQDVGKLTRD